MSGELYQILIPVIVALFIFWLLYRIKRRIIKIVRNKIIDDFPNITNKIDSFQQKVDYLNVRVEFLERKVNELEKSR